jgi:hypothetical protein
MKTKISYPTDSELYEFTLEYVKHCNAANDGSHEIYNLCCDYHLSEVTENGLIKLKRFFAR